MNQPKIFLSGNKLNRVTREATSTHPDVSMQEVVSVKCPKAQKEYFTVIKNVRKGHQIQDDGEFQVRPLKKLLRRWTQQVQVVPSFVRHCKKTFHQNRLFWGLGIGYF